MRNETTTKSINTKIKRLPGQSLRDEQQKLLDQLTEGPLILMALAWSMFSCECLHFFIKTHKGALLGTTLAFTVFMTVYATFKMFKTRQALKNYKRGEAGERLVAQAIEQDLIPRGYTVFHDIPLEKDGRKFNIDHLLVGPNGIFAIETKNYAKPSKGSPEVKYNGKELLWNGARHKNCDELAQAKSAALSAKTLIAQLTGINVYVHPVLCAVGWFANSTNLFGHPVLLTMEKTLKSTIPKVAAKQQLSSADYNKIIASLRQTAQ